MRQIIILTIFLIPVTGFSLDQIPEKRSYFTQSIQNAPDIDGKLDDPCWEQGAWDSDFTQQIPNSGGEPSQKTMVKVLYDEDYLYVAIKCLDNEPDKIRKIFNRRDEFAGDVTGIAFDSYHDLQTAFEFNVTAAGQKVDLKHHGEGDIDLNWNAIWEVKTDINQEGWYAEMKIPFNQLRYNTGQTDTWGMHVWRWIDRNREETQWQLIPQDAPARVFMFGNLKGIQIDRASRQVEVLPYASVNLENNAGEENPYVKDWDPGINGGLDTKIGIASNYTLDVAINPDFGQVEADPSELNLSSFETFFQEKRPFFLEGREIFDFRIDRDRLFYSRRIGSAPSYYPEIDEDEYLERPRNSTILASAKLTGRSSKGLSLGLMNSTTAKEFGRLYSSGPTEKVPIEPLTNYFAGRIKQEFNNSNTIIGFSFNNVIRDNNEESFQSYFAKNAFSGGMDFTHYFSDRNYFITGKLAGSRINGSSESILNIQQSHLHRFMRPDADHIELDSTRTQLSGSAATLRMGKQGGQIKYGIKFSYWSPQYNINDIGFLRLSDKIEQQAWINYESIESKGIFRKYYFELDNKVNSTFGGEITENEFGLESWMEFKNLWSAFVKGMVVLPSKDPRILRGGPALMQEAWGGVFTRIRSNGSKRFYGSLNGGYWHSFRNPTNYYEIGFGAHYNPIDQLSIGIELEYQKNFDNYQYIQTVENGEHKIYMLGTIDRDILNAVLRLEFFVTPELSIQYYGSPYLSAGSYDEFKRVETPASGDQYERYHFYDPAYVMFDPASSMYSFSELNNPGFDLDNPDFAFAQFRSNLVLRWEYKLGSVLYLVWAHEQTGSDNFQAPGLHDSFNSLGNSNSNNILMLKLNYWFAL